MPKIISVLYQVYAFSLSLLLVVFILLAPSLVSLPLTLRWRLKIIMPAWKLFGHAVIKLVTFSPYYYEDKRSPKAAAKKPLNGLYICNHQSMLDIPLLLTRFQIPPIMKKQVLSLPIFGLVAWASGAIPVERDSKESRKKVFEACKKRLKQAIAVQYYPEGTRSRLPEGKPKDFDAIKTTLIEYAYQENIPVYSCACHGTFAILQAGSISFKPFKPVGVIVNEALYPKNFTSADDFAQACWKQTLTTHKELQRKLAQQKSATFFRRAINLLR